MLSYSTYELIHALISIFNCKLTSQDVIASFHTSERKCDSVRDFGKFLLIKITLG